MTRWLVGVAAVGVFGGTGFAQYGYADPYGGGFGGPAAGGAGMPYPYTPQPFQAAFAPNFYNRANQPLSPYLNLLRGSNPSVNYFYGVRPGLGAGGSPIGGGFGANFPVQMSALQGGFNPALAVPTQEPQEGPPAGRPLPYIPASTHPVIYGGGPGRQSPITGTTSAQRGGFGPQPRQPFGGGSGGATGTPPPRTR
ncbi:MAG: hypothetical protein U0871_03865 [Gemmataceae bacterium]